MKQVRNVFMVLFAATAINSAKANEKDIFSTWEGFEADKCASIWLIKRFIAPKAEIRFYPRGNTLAEGIPFDTPDSKFRRYYNKSTFETLQQHYQIADKGVVYIGRIIHDIEVNIWGNKMMSETNQVMSELQPIIVEKSSGEAVAECCVYFDQMYKTLN